MVNLELPYGRENLVLELPDEKIAGILVSKAHHYKKTGNETEIVKKALTNPINSPTLRELAKGKKNIVIISSDHTRPVPSHVTMPVLLDEIRAGNPHAEVTILVATGYHRPTTADELRSKYGQEIFERENIIVHNGFCAEDTVNIGKLPSGGELKINKLALQADLLLAEGFIEPHMFAGFSGGRKSVLPGIASKDTVMANHCAEFIASEYARAGILDGNPIHKDMIYAAKEAKLAFILNVVIDAEKKVIEAFAGHYNDAHRKGCEFVRELAGVKAIPADIVIITNGGYPLDQNIYQTVKGMASAEGTCKPGGVIIAVSSCNQGHGGEAFYETMAKAKDPQEVMDEIICRPADQTVPDQWESQILSRILIKHKVIMVTDAPREMVEKMHMIWSPDITSAIKLAEDILKKDSSKITIIPDGVSVIVLN